MIVVSAETGEVTSVTCQTRQRTKLSKVFSDDLLMSDLRTAAVPELPVERNMMRSRFRTRKTRKYQPGFLTNEEEGCLRGCVQPFYPKLSVRYVTRCLPSNH